MLQIARQKGLVPVVGNMVDPPLLDNFFDGVISRQTFQYLTQDESICALRNANSLLTDSGRLILHHMTIPEWDEKRTFQKFMNVDGYPCRFQTEAEFFADVSDSGFSEVISRSVTHMVQESIDDFCSVRNIPKKQFTTRGELVSEIPEYNMQLGNGYITYSRNYTLIHAKK